MPSSVSGYVISNVVGSCEPLAIPEPYAITRPVPDSTCTSSRELSVETAGKRSLNAHCPCDHARTVTSVDPWTAPFPSYAVTRTFAR